MPSEANVLIAIPAAGGIHPILVSRLIRWGRILPEERVHFYFAYKVAPVDRARNQIVDVFLKTKLPDGRQFTHLLMIDSDSGGTLSLDPSGDWIGTFDGQEGSFYLANAFSTTSANAWSSLGLGFSTTSANYWQTQRNLFSTTSADYWKTQNNFFSTTSASHWATFGLGFSTTSANTWSSFGFGFSTTSANYWRSLGFSFSTTSANAWSAVGLGFSTTSANTWSSFGLGFSTTSATNFVHSSTTIPKTYATNTFTALQTFGNSSTSVASFAYASSTLYYGAGLQTCDPTTGKLTWSAGGFGCGTDQAGIGGDGTFSTTSADYWKTQNNFFSTTSANTWATFGLGFSTTSASVWSSLGLGFSTTSANYWRSLGLSFSTTSSNAWSALGLGFSTTSANYWKTQNTFEAITAGDALTRTGDDIDFDGGATPGGVLGGTWASPTLDDNYLLNTGDTGTGLYTFSNSSTSLASFAYASSTLWYGGGLISACEGGNFVTWVAGKFGCAADTVGSGGGGLATSTAIADTYMIYGTSAGTVGAEAAFTYDDATNLLTVQNASTTQLSASSALWYPAGTIAAPGLRLSGTQTGITSSGVDLNFGIGGASILQMTAALISPQTFMGTAHTGSAIETSYSFSGDADTGMWRSAANALNLTAGATDALVLRTSGASTTNLTVAGYASSTSATVSATTTTLGLSVSGAVSLLGEYFTNFTTYVRSLFTGGTGITLSGGDISFDCSEVEGTGINCSGENITLDATGDWTGTFDGQEGSYYLDGENIANDTIDDDSIDFSDVTLADLTFDVGNVSTTEFGYLDGVTSAIQTQLNALGTIAGQVWTGNHDFGGATFLEIPNGTNPTANDPGELAHDTTDNQLILDDFVMARAVQKIWSVTVASTSPAFISGGLLKVPTELDGYTMTAIRCSVQSGTNKVIAVEDESGNSSEDITCTTSVTSDDGSITNATATAAEEMYIDFGSTSGAVDYVSISVFGTWTRE